MIGIKNPKASYSFILTDEAADFLYKIGKSSFTGPINPGCAEDISLEDLIRIIENRVGKSANIVHDALIANTSRMHFQVLGLLTRKKRIDWVTNFQSYIKFWMSLLIIIVRLIIR
jgi:nucleoside-diphosphate-sugar epimerase